MANIDTIRFKRLPGKARRYLDRETGAEVSRRRAIETSAGTTIERLTRESMQTKPQWKKGSSTLRTLEQYVRSRGKPVRGEKAEDFRELKRKIKETPKEEWINVLYDYEDPDFWDDIDWEDFFDSPGESK